MDFETLAALRHDHVFLGAHHGRNERKVWIVVGVCTLMMIAEIAGGVVFRSMALTADGLHMATHAGAMLIAALAYLAARRWANDPRFSFGTGKLGDLAAFSSALILGGIALLIAIESVQRLIRPEAIAFDEAIPIAAIGLIVNVVTAWLLRDEHDHGHGHGHGHDHDAHEHDHGHDDHHDHDHHHRGHHHHDLNLRAAYVHVLADSAVSVLAIAGLCAGKYFGWTMLDPVMGIVGSIVIAAWALGLMRAAGRVLLDMRPDGLAGVIAERLETEHDRLVDLHVWRIGPGHHAAIVSLVCREPQPQAVYRNRLDGLGLSHVTIEVAGPHIAAPSEHAPKTRHAEPVGGH